MSGKNLDRPGTPLGFEASGGQAARCGSTMNGFRRVLFPVLITAHSVRRVCGLGPPELSFSLAKQRRTQSGLQWIWCQRNLARPTINRKETERSMKLNHASCRSCGEPLATVSI